MLAGACASPLSVHHKHRGFSAPRSHFQWPFSLYSSLASLSLILHALLSISESFLLGKAVLLGSWGRRQATTLVLLFTSPSGHGKTELASSIGSLLSLPLLEVQCNLLSNSTDLFGTHAGYAGWAQCSPLSAHLAQHAGRRSVVFLDEFDKTSEEVRQSLLLIFDGKYTDRRNNKSLECSKTIWVLAVNLGLPAIRNFWEDHLKGRSEEQQDKAPYEELEKLLKQSLRNLFGSPLTRRLTDVVPFVPFHEGEQAVVTFKFMRSLKQEVRKPIEVESKNLVRNTFLDFVDDGQIVKFIAAEYYDPNDGASSLRNAVTSQIHQKLATTWYREIPLIIDEMNEEPLPNYDVSVTNTFEDDDEVVVERNGTRELQS